MPSPRIAPYILCVALAALGSALSYQSVSSIFERPCCAAETKLPEVVTDEYAALEKLFKQFYPEGKIVRAGDAIHVEYKLKRQTQLCVQAGGILCDVSFIPGKCAETQSTTSYGRYSTQTIETYSSSLESHLLAKLVYPANGCSSDFRNQFTELIRKFGPSNSAMSQHAHEMRLADVANKPLPPDLPLSQEDAAAVPAGASASTPSTTGTSSSSTANTSAGATTSGSSDFTASTAGSSETSRPPLDLTMVPPSRRQSRFASKYDNQTQDQPLSLFNMEEFPTTLPEVISTGPLKLSAVQNIKLEEKQSRARVDEATNNLPETAAFQSAQAAMKKGDYRSAAKLYESLAAKHPREPRYFYGAGAAYRMMGDNRDAFSNFVIAWHLGGMQPEYEQAAQDTVRALQTEIDDTFKLTFGYRYSDPEALLNAGVRCWKAGLTQQSTQLFNYAMRNEPLYAGVAAFDLGATAERNGQFKLALQYYDWAEKVTLRMQSAQAQNPMYRGQIQKALGLLPLQSIEQARSDVMYKLKASDSRWTGWEQATRYPSHWTSEVCPLCTINRRNQGLGGL
jgi:tetratricopeptide (TPR) repeat protein